MKEIPSLGMIRDMRYRATKARHDNAEYRQKIKLAREKIYTDHLTVNNVHTERYLQSESLVPTEVRRNSTTHRKFHRN